MYTGLPYCARTICLKHIKIQWTKYKCERQICVFGITCNHAYTCTSCSKTVYDSIKTHDNHKHSTWLSWGTHEKVYLEQAD